MLTIERARELNDSMVTEEHLRIHALNVAYAMAAMARHFGEDEAHWQAIGILHDYDYEKYPDEHLQHTKEPLLAAGVEEAFARMGDNFIAQEIVEQHGWKIKAENTAAGAQFVITF